MITQPKAVYKAFKISLFSLIVCGTSIYANAQQKTKYPVKRYLYHSHGISFQNFENLNSRVSAFPQFEQSKKTTGTIQFGLISERKKLVTAFTLNAGSSLSGNRNTKSTATNFWGLSADAGYKFLSGSRFSFYPFAGVGYENYKMTFNQDISALAFDSLFQSAANQQRAENLVFSNSFIVYRIGFSANVSSRKNLQNSVGVQVGYTGSFAENDWKINKSQTLLNSPKDKLSKVFASIIIRYELIHKK